MDRITRIRITNVKSIEDAVFDLAPVTVLVGENGSGKSTVIEVLSLLAHAPHRDLFTAYYPIYGGAAALARNPQEMIGVEVQIEGDGEPIHYKLRIGNDGLREAILVGGASWIVREPGEYVMDGKREATTGSSWSMIHRLRGHPDARARRFVAAFERLEVHVGWDVLASWAGASVPRPVPLRMPQLVQPVDQLHIQGGNLTTAWHALRNEYGAEHWANTMDLVRIGLGDHVEDVMSRAAGDGYASMSLKLRGREANIPARGLSDGQLAWLAFVGLVRLPSSGGTLVLDEPELHLHPQLVARVVDLLETHSAQRSVLIATHSDRLLDCLRQPSDSVVVCALDDLQRTVTRRLDRNALASWMRRYAGFGSIRSAGHEDSVIASEPTS